MIRKGLNRNIISGVIQLISLGLYAISILTMIKNESIVLNPIPYFIGLAVVIIIIDILILLYVFKESDAQNIVLTNDSETANIDVSNQIFEEEEINEKPTNEEPTINTEQSDIIKDSKEILKEEVN